MVTAEENPTAKAGTGSISALGRFHMLQSNEACGSQLRSPCTTVPEACAPKACALQQERPLQREAHAPHQRVAPTHCDSGKPKRSNEDPAQPKIND